MKRSTTHIESHASSIKACRVEVVTLFEQVVEAHAVIHKKISCVCMGHHLLQQGHSDAKATQNVHMIFQLVQTTFRPKKHRVALYAQTSVQPCSHEYEPVHYRDETSESGNNRQQLQSNIQYYDFYYATCETFFLSVS